MSKYVDKINFLIEDEYEAIDGYNEVMKFFEDFEEESKDTIIKQLEHIKEEEEEHIRELNEVKKLLEDSSYTPDLDTLEDTKTLTEEQALEIASLDLDEGVEEAINKLSELGFDTTLYKETMDRLLKDGEVGSEIGEKYVSPELYARDLLYKYLGIEDIMEKAYEELD